MDIIYLEMRWRDSNNCAKLQRSSGEAIGPPWSRIVPPGLLSC